MASKTLRAVRNGTIRAPKTQRGSARQYDWLLRAYLRTYSGGGMFGYDSRTMAVQEPELFQYLTSLARGFDALPT